MACRKGELQMYDGSVSEEQKSNTDPYPVKNKYIDDSVQKSKDVQHVEPTILQSKENKNLEHLKQPGVGEQKSKADYLVEPTILLDASDQKSRDDQNIEHPTLPVVCEQNGKDNQNLEHSPIVRTQNCKDGKSLEHSSGVNSHNDKDSQNLVNCNRSRVSAQINRDDQNLEKSQRPEVGGRENRNDQHPNDEGVSLNDENPVVRLYRLLPWAYISRCFGMLAGVELPRPLGGICVLVYSTLFGCNLQEAEHNSVWDYPSIGAFFTRSLTATARTVSCASRLVAPADGTLNFAGQFTGGSLQQVKGVRYSLPLFLGRPDCSQPLNLLQRTNSALYQVVIYLSPGDYHGFHSPARWRCRRLFHVAGELLSVAPPLMRNVPGLLHLNERVVLEGSWRYGYFCLVAVGATNVGTIAIQWEPQLQHTALNTTQVRKVFERPVDLRPGEKVGQFRLGSSIVLLFEAPSGLHFTQRPMHKIKYGEHLL